MINVKNVKHLNICKTNATDHQDACTASRFEIINVNYLHAKISNHAITCFLDVATVKMRTSQIA